MLYLAGPMQKVALRHVDSTKEYCSGNALRAAENLVEHRLARDNVPQTRGGPFADECIPVRLTADSEWGSSSTTFPEWFAVMIYVLIELLFKIVYQFSSGHQVFNRFLTIAMARDIGTSVI